jgi:hypothetical protein
MAIKCTYQHLPLQDPPIFTLIGIFGLKIYDLATLPSSRKQIRQFSKPIYLQLPFFNE